MIIDVSPVPREPPAVVEPGLALPKRILLIWASLTESADHARPRVTRRIMSIGEMHCQGISISLGVGYELTESEKTYLDLNEQDQQQELGGVVDRVQHDEHERYQT